MIFCQITLKFIESTNKKSKNERKELLFEYSLKNKELIITKDFQNIDKNNLWDNEEVSEISKKSFINWWTNIYTPGLEQSISLNLFQLYSGTWEKHFKYIRNSGSYNPETNQVNFQVSCLRQADPEEILDELNYLLPFLKPIKQGECFKKEIKVFEDNLSEFGIYILSQVINENKIALFKIFYGSTKKEKEFENWLEAIKYCQIYHSSP